MLNYQIEAITAQTSVISMQLDGTGILLSKYPLLNFYKGQPLELPSKMTADGKALVEQLMELPCVASVTIRPKSLAIGSARIGQFLPTREMEAAGLKQVSCLELFAQVETVLRQVFTKHELQRLPDIPAFNRND